MFQQLSYQVQGKSMVDVGINDGDLLVVDKSLNQKTFQQLLQMCMTNLWLKL